ncbi:MAG: peptide-methionine (R)-S-oxide reductase MsrB [Pseudomonadota bacterium]
MSTSRRNFLIGTLGISGFIVLQFISGKSKRLYPGDNTITKLELSDEEWKKRLSENAYQVLRKGKTENRNSSPLNKEWRKGIYVCQGCGLELFTSDMKYESNTGWPSFTSHILGHLTTYTDLKAIPPQRGYRCTRCGGHHGHLFMDGPLPKGERWCSNGAALKFIPA